MCFPSLWPQASLRCRLGTSSRSVFFTWSTFYLTPTRTRASNKNWARVQGSKQRVCLLPCRATSVPGGAARPHGDVPLFHHSAAEVPPSLPPGNRPHSHSQTRHDPAAQTLLHLRSPQAAEESLFGSCFLSQVAHRAIVCSLNCPSQNLLFCTECILTRQVHQNYSWCHVAGVEHDGTFNSISSILDARSSVCRYK